MEEVHEAFAVQEVFKNRFLGQGKAFFLDHEGAGLADDLICPDPVWTVFGTGPTEQALGNNFVKALAEITIFFSHPFNQAQLPSGDERFFQRFHIDWTLSHASAALHTLPGFFHNLG
jgi:hypothetical protein